MKVFTENWNYSLITIRKLRGQPPEPPVTARPCVGLCYLKRLNGEIEQTTTRKPQPPCIGLCYLEKIGKIAKKEVKQAEDDKVNDYDVEGSVGDGGDYEEDYEDKWDSDVTNIKY